MKPFFSTAFFSSACLTLLFCGFAGAQQTCFSQPVQIQHVHSQAVELQQFQQQIQTRAVMRGNCKINVREFGSPDGRPTIVLMHGFPDSLHLYDLLTPQLAGRHVVAFDFLGWGDSDKPLGHQYNFKSLEYDLDAVITQMNLQQVVLVVHDASGPTGINWALANPNRTAGLVLLNTIYSKMDAIIPPEEIELFSTPGIKQQVAVKLTTKNDRLWRRRFEKQISKFMLDENVKGYFLNVLGQQSYAIRPAFYGLNQDLQPEFARNLCNVEQLQYLNVPVRIIFGCGDPYLNPSVAREFQRLFPQADLHLIRNAGHYVQVDKPAEVGALIRDFR